MGRVAKLSKAILLALLVGGALVVLLSSPAGVRQLTKAVGYELKSRRERQRFFWTLAYLRRKRYLDYRVEPDGTVAMTLTEDGKRRALRYNLETMSLTRPRRWDGKWRIVIFDIPEKKRAGREALRAKFRELGLVKLQKSVWAWPYECKNEVDFIAEVFEVGQYVHYLVVESLTSEKFLKYTFNLM